MIDRNNDSWAYKKGYEDGKKWGHYDYSIKPGPEYDAGFMAGYFEKYGYTFVGKTYTQREEERNFQKALQNKQIQSYNQQQDSECSLPSFSLNRGSLLENLVKLLIQIVKSVLGLLFRSDCQNAQAIFGSVNKVTLEALKIVKALVLVGAFLLLPFVHSLFNNNGTVKRIDSIENISSQNTVNEQVQDKVTTDKDIILDNSTELGQYMSNVQSSIKKNWIIPPEVSVRGIHDVKITVAFTVFKDGRLIGEPKIKLSSGVERADELCIEAVKLTAPFKPFPPEINKDYVDMEFTFEATRKE